MYKKNEKTSIVKEPAAAYKTKKRTSNTVSHLSLVHKKENPIVRWLGGEKVVTASLISDFDFIHAGIEGITKASVDALTTYLGISKKSMAEDILDISIKTMERKKPSDKLDKKTSSLVLEIAKVLQHAYEVFEDEEKVKRWLNTENRALNKMKPIELLHTLTGLTMVNDILGRIEEGVYS